MRTFVLGVLAALLVGGCGQGEDVSSQKITVVVGGGDRAEDRQTVISQVESVKVGDEVLCASLPCRGDASGWNMKKTLDMSRAVSGGEEATVTLKGPKGTVDCEVTFAGGMFSDKERFEVWGEQLEVHCYYSVGSKWALIVYVNK